jgi:SAM-dependent methyltransferase
MQPTASEEPLTGRYDFSFAWDSAYGHVVEMLGRLDLERGAVLDLGCGFGSIADPIAELGYHYVGTDIDEESLAQLTKRGFEAHRLDLLNVEELPGRMQELAGERSVAAVLLLDVIEHLPQTRRSLAAIRAGLDRLGAPILIVSVPNVAHIDVGAKLVFGRWDYTSTGLLDSTHLQLFTSARLSMEARACGLIELDANDFRLTASDQRFPADHPALCAESPPAQAMRTWRDIADPHGETIQFIRAFASYQLASESPSSDFTLAQPTTVRPLTVVMRTQGKRPHSLRDALTCLAAQTVDDFGVLLMVHTDRPDTVVPMVTKLVDEFGPVFSLRVRVVPVGGGGRARPLNAALDLVSGEYVAFLDDDDVVTADWVEAFLGAIEEHGHGVIVRSVGAVRHVSAASDHHCAPYLVDSGLEFRYSERFDPVHHIWGNETPICTFAVPRQLIDIGLRFDEQLPVLEDWEFLLKCVSFAGVRDTGKVTSIYQMWQSGESSASLHDATLWQAAQRIIQDRTNTMPLVLPAGSANGLITRCEQSAALEHVQRDLESARVELARQIESMTVSFGQLTTAHEELERLRRDYQVTINSRRWRVLSPLARAIAAMRKIAVNDKGHVGVGSGGRD